MAFEKRPNTFVMFTSKRKDRNNPAHEKYADRDGTLDVEQCCSKCGHKENASYFMDAWVKKPGTPEQFLSGVVKLKQQQAQPSVNASARQGLGYAQPQAPTPPRSQRPLGDIDDEIPF